MTRLPSLGPRGEGWVVLQVILIAVVFAAGLTGPDWSGLPRVAGVVAGVAAIGAGGLLAWRGLRDLGSALTPAPRPREGATLIETGVYARARHPIYGGIIVAAAGWALVTAAVLAVVAGVLLGAFFTVKSMREEAWLETVFPGYPAYRQRTHRFLPRP